MNTFLGFSVNLLSASKLRTRDITYTKNQKRKCVLLMAHVKGTGSQNAI